MNGSSRSRYLVPLVLTCLAPVVTAAFASLPQQRGDPPARVPPASGPPQIAGNQKDQIDYAIKLNKDGQALFSQGQHDKGEEMLRQSLALFLKVVGERDFRTALAYNNLAVILDERNKLSEAEQMLRKSLAIRLSLYGENHVDTATSQVNLATLLSKQDRDPEAADLARKSLAVRAKLLGENHADTLAVRRILAKSLLEIGFYSEAEEIARKDLAHARKVHGEGSAELANALQLLATARLNQGDYAQAERHYRKSLAIQRRLAGEDSKVTLRYFSNLAVSLHRQGQFIESEAINRAVLTKRIKLLGESHADVGDSLNNLAGDLFEQLQYEEAEALHRKALALRLKIHAKDHPDVAMTYGNLALILGEQDKAAEAEEMYGRALEIYKKLYGERHPEIARNLLLLGLNMARQGKFQQAEQLDRKALEIYRKNFGEYHPETVRAYLHLARRLYDQGDYKEAERLFQFAAKSYDKVRSGVNSTGLGRARFAVNFSPMLNLAVLQARNGKPTEAWTAFEEGLARGLFDDVSSNASRNLTAQERQKQESILADLARIEKALAADQQPDSANHQKLILQREQLLATRLDLFAELAKKYDPAQGKVYDLPRIQASLSSSQALVAWLDQGAFSQAKDPNGEHWGIVVRHQGPPIIVKIPGTGPEQSWQEADWALPSMVFEKLHNPDQNVDWQSWINDLAKQRMRPLLPHLEGVTHLVVLHAGRLNNIPIEVLTDRFVISYAPSATMFAWLREKHSSLAAGAGKVLTLADPLFSPDQYRSSRVQQDAMSKILRAELKPLPGTRGEAKAIAKLFPPANMTSFMGADANSANVEMLSNAKKLAEYRYLHLATHGFADAKNWMSSYLALTPSDVTIASCDKLSAGEIRRTWQLDADLVALSACTTALGQYLIGEGYVGFAQALFSAGARSVLLSKWSVSDISTTLLMERFYQNLLGKREGLKAPLSKVDALDEARRWLKGLKREEAIKRLKELDVPIDPTSLARERPFEHPFYWAPFVLVGDPGLPANGKTK